MSSANFNVRAAIIDGKYYRVEDFPVDEIKAGNTSVLKKAVAYYVKTDITNQIYPFRGDINSTDDWEESKLSAGIYRVRLKRDKYVVRIVRPKTKAELELYSPNNIKDIASAVVGGDYTPDQFADIKFNISAAGKSFLPPLYADDDPMNRIIKTGIRLKDAPFELYGKRMEATAVNKKKGVEGINIRNNTKRAILSNRSMSASKAVTNCDTWQMRMAIILTDAPDSVNPMFEDEESGIIIYANSEPFPIIPEKLTNVADVIAADEDAFVMDLDDEDDE